MSPTRTREPTIARRSPPEVNGLAVVDKAAGWTSHDVVAKARGLLHERRIGHAGTLDPDATGVLLLGVGVVTRLLRYLSESGKRYTGEVVLGVATDTLDAAGNVVATFEMDVTEADVRRVVAEHLTGPILQVPPMVSALKVGGRRLHELAREGIEVEREARPVVITRFDVEATPSPLVYRIDVECSSGTYVRSLAADLGALLGGGAHLRALRRTAVGSFTLAEAHPLEQARRPAAGASGSRPPGRDGRRRRGGRGRPRPRPRPGHRRSDRRLRPAGRPAGCLRAPPRSGQALRRRAPGDLTGPIGSYTPWRGDFLGLSTRWRAGDAPGRRLEERSASSLDLARRSRAL